MHSRTLAALALVLALALAACDGAPEIVWPDGATSGAAVIACPTADCSAVIAAAERGLDRQDPGHRPVVRDRLGTTVCSRDGKALCTISPPIGLGHAFVGILDLEGGASVLIPVRCWLEPVEGPSVVPWNGQRCEGTWS